jgi:hypothetical protein
MRKKIRKSNMRIKNAEISNILEASKILDLDFSSISLQKILKNHQRGTQKVLI